MKLVFDESGFDELVLYRSAHCVATGLPGQVL